MASDMMIKIDEEAKRIVTIAAKLIKLQVIVTEGPII